MKRWALCFGVGLGLLMATACGREDATQDTASPGAPAAIQAPGGQAGAAPRVVDVTMSFIEPRFRPNPMVIQVGKPVQFKVTSADTRHTFVIDALGIAVEVPQKSLDETVTTPVVTPQQAGEFRIHCRTHSRLPMEGKLVVSETAQP